jgi:hypothetical protein
VAPARQQTPTSGSDNFDTVLWIFAQRLAGGSLVGIARDLNDRGVPCPSQADRRRNRHRHGGAWTLQAVRAIVANPRYTGRQVWNRQHIQYRHTYGGRVRVQQWNATDQWVVSARPAHPALVSEADFIAVQAIRSTRAASDGAPRTHRLAGLLRCGICGRRRDSHWVNNRPGYRCRHGHTSARPATAHDDRERAVCLREDELLHDLATALHQGSGRPPTADEVPGLLRARKITIICTRTQRTLAHPRWGTPSPMGQFWVRGSTRTPTQPRQRLQGTICAASRCPRLRDKGDATSRTLKRSPQVSHTEGLIDVSRHILTGVGARVDVVWTVDHVIPPGVYPDMREQGRPADDFPDIYHEFIEPAHMSTAASTTPPRCCTPCRTSGSRSRRRPTRAGTVRPVPARPTSTMVGAPVTTGRRGTRSSRPGTCCTPPADWWTPGEYPHTATSPPTGT